MQSRLEICLNKFYGRTEALSAIPRYESISPMFYRTTVYEHTKHVGALAAEISETLQQRYPKINVRKLVILGEIHDDHEIKDGDVQANQKYEMTEEQRKKLDQQAEQTVISLAAQWPQRVLNFSYIRLALDAHASTSFEAKVIKLVDKISGHCEAIHELYAGNTLFREPVENYIYKHIPKVLKKFPELSELHGLHPILTFPPYTEIHVEEIMKNQREHTAENLFEKTGILFYDAWKKVVTERLGIECLTEKRELAVPATMHIGAYMLETPPAANIKMD